MKRCIGAFRRNQSGATAIEYALIAAFIALALIAALRSLGANLNTNFTTIKDTLQQ